MSDLIDRQALVDAFECLDLIDRQAATKSLVRPRIVDPYEEYWTGRNDQYDADVFALKGLPSAEPERKKGHWKKSYADHESFGVRPFFRYCSECHESTLYAYNYCPNCGADMRGGEDERERVLQVVGKESNRTGQ